MQIDICEGPTTSKSGNQKTWIDEIFVKIWTELICCHNQLDVPGADSTENNRKIELKNAAIKKYFFLVSKIKC